MKTKAQIVQELLDKDYITAEDAVVLLIKEREYITVPSQPIFPYNPYPHYHTGPIYVTSKDSVAPIITFETTSGGGSTVNPFLTKNSLN